jgi:hypothetical protein
LLYSGDPLPGWQVLIAFDDGTADSHERAWPILRRTGSTTQQGLASRREHPLRQPRIEVRGDLGLDAFAHSPGLPVPEAPAITADGGMPA